MPKPKPIIPTCSFFIKSSAQKKLGYYNVNYKYCADYDMFYKMIVKKNMKYINKELFKNDKKERIVADFIAGMTDRYAINLHKKII